MNTGGVTEGAGSYQPPIRTSEADAANIKHVKGAKKGKEKQRLLLPAKNQRHRS